MFIGYWWGHHYRERLRTAWPMKKHHALFDRSQAYFTANGGKSVFFGRFLGSDTGHCPRYCGNVWHDSAAILFHEHCLSGGMGRCPYSSRGIVWRITANRRRCEFTAGHHLARFRRIILASLSGCALSVSLWLAAHQNLA